MAWLFSKKATLHDVILLTRVCWFAVFPVVAFFEVLTRHVTFNDVLKYGFELSLTFGVLFSNLDQFSLI